MGLTKRELEEINEELQRRIHALTNEAEGLREENARLRSSSSARLRELEELYARLTRRYERLKSLLIEHLDETA
jgi:acetylornithine deacetylase/succinyl-diaminopimelate desuccinylase-like protein